MNLFPIILCDPPREMEQMRDYAREVFDRPAEVVVLEARPPILDPDNPPTGFREGTVYWPKEVFAVASKLPGNRAARRRRK